MREIREKLVDMALETRVMGRDAIPRKEALDMFKELMEIAEEGTLLVPHYVHEWFESQGGTARLLSSLMEEVSALSHKKREHLTRRQRNTIDWLLPEGRRGTYELANAQELIAKMYCNDYMVEEAPRYYVVSPQGRVLLTRTMPCKEIIESREQPKVAELRGSLMEAYQLTEEEIVGYDERYWPFASLIGRKDLW